ncbi:fungal-specific transcription factor domain-containing protein [Colletotrichum phormii]|uniref:Fungal-specific transcription factor domain-containing protein n=1 Tax=Colletotrichum phormii TaxID=359342 RepID=A0AAI9ZN30_9PEZI|nr:fungal-specific transcription factor domain-containing protein [Colletotrichum phormii]KAK1635037.1 fungal-specific transcription factor domain-containing protein [Colletotrichum phormii]
MSGSSPPTSALKPGGDRARVACKACRSRRVKCDAGDAHPCWQCRTRQIPCEIVESRRGKYIRKKRNLQQKQSRAQSQQVQAARTDQDSAEQETEAPNEVFIEDGSFTNSPVTSDEISNDGQLQPSQTQKNQRQHPCSVDLSLSYIVEVVHRPKDGSTEPVKVHYPIPACIADQSAYNHVPKVIETISLQEALTMPAPHIADQLIRPFFEIMHPAYPVFDRESFSRQYRQGQASPLVLQAIFLLGFTVCDDSLIEEAGFSDRATARRTHYLRAKALYDAEYESDHMNLVAVMLLLGFWWAGPEDQKDNCYWVNCAATMAQSLGMHRSMSHSALSPRMRSLRKRIWWAIYTRDRHTAAAFGRPCRIRDEDCDIEPLTDEDFEFDKNGDERLIPAQHKYHVSYVMEMARLTTILGDIIVSEFSPRRAMIEKYEAKSLKKELRRWNSSLPEHLSPAPLDGSLGASFWASMVQFTYQYCHILLFRPKAIDNLTPAEAERDKQARMAADAITRNAEDLLAAETIRSAQIHLVPTLFGALSIHTIVICRKDPIRRQLAENKSRQCLLALSQLSKSWPVRLWISKSFVSLMRRLTGQGSIVNVTSSIHGPNYRTFAPQYAGEETNPAMLDSFHSTGEVGTETAGLNTAQPEAPPGQESFHQATDQMFYDTFWADYLDNTFDVDLLIHSHSGFPSNPLGQ